MGFGKWFVVAARLLVEGTVAVIEWAKPVEKDKKDRERKVKEDADAARERIRRGN